MKPTTGCEDCDTVKTNTTCAQCQVPIQSCDCFDHCYECRESVCDECSKQVKCDYCWSCYCNVCSKRDSSLVICQKCNKQYCSRCMFNNCPCPVCPQCWCRCGFVLYCAGVRAKKEQQFINNLEEQPQMNNFVDVLFTQN
jgi:hypothetical protein